MRIADSVVAMHSEHLSMVRTERTQSLRVWVNRQPAAPVPSAADAKTVASQANDDSIDDPRLMLLKAVLEHLTGKPIKLLHMVRLDALGPAGDGAGTAVPGPGEFAVEVDTRATRQEVEQTGFSAAGQVTTADGRQIDFALNLEMSRNYTEQIDVNLRAGNAKRKDPLVINTGGATAQLSTQRMSFDLDADGQKEEVPLLAGGGAYLALDLNQNGKIDSGAELFGPTTGTGFSELAKYDADGNGWIDENDPVFKQLRAWKPAAEGDGRLSSLESQGIGALFLGNQATSFQLRGPRNEDLGVVRASGIYLSESGQAGSLQQIDLTV